MAASQFNRYIWLVDTIRSAGRISRQDIDRRWAHSPFNEKGEDGIPERTFFRYKIAIEELFGIDICCDRTSGKYYLAESNYESRTKQWLLSQFALSNSLSDSRQLQGRILYEEIPKGTQFLTTITQAMSENRYLQVSHQRFDSTELHEFLIAPYCLKVFKQRWYLLGKKKELENVTNKRNVDLRIYALDRIQSLKITDKTFNLPKSFDAGAYFTNYYGVFCGKDYQPEIVRARVVPKAAPYLRSLPLHHSQAEPEPCVFTWYIAPTLDFVQQLRTFGSDMEVLAPESLRELFAEENLKLARMY